MIAGFKASFRSIPTQALAVSLAAVAVLAVLLVLVLTDAVGVPAAIITAAVPVTLGLVGQFLSTDRQNKREIEAKLRERKSTVYEGFIKFWMDFLMLPENRDKWQTHQNQFVKSMNEYSKAMMLWASNDVVRSYAEFRRRLVMASNEASGKPGIETMIHFEQMLFLMREDMGHDPDGFRQLDLLSFFINDIHHYERNEAGVWQKK